MGNNYSVPSDSVDISYYQIQCVLGKTVNVKCANKYETSLNVSSGFFRIVCGKEDSFYFSGRASPFYNIHLSKNDEQCEKVNVTGILNKFTIEEGVSKMAGIFWGVYDIKVWNIVVKIDNDVYKFVLDIKPFYHVNPRIPIRFVNTTTEIDDDGDFDLDYFDYD